MSLTRLRATSANQMTSSSPVVVWCPDSTNLQEFLKRTPHADQEGDRTNHPEGRMYIQKDVRISDR